MDLKPIVTNFGDDKLYIPLSKEIERRLPSKSVEWKRSFGRLAKTVCLKATFTRYNPDTLGGTSEGSVNKQPFLHIYWTSCMENDDYRNSIKQRITNWQQNLKSRDIHDWLVIQVVTQDQSKPNRPKITLPRSSVFDKIRNDICGKVQSRCAQLWEPDKETLSTKSAESWSSLVAQLRELLLESISRHLTKFEEKVRHQREKYAEPNWSFVEYLKLNEELATIFKSVTLHEDALIQYDELDALFSQFVVNGKIKGRPGWLEQFTNDFYCWDGVSLHKQAVKYYRDIVYGGKATLLELRNYIFIRQWQMLTKVNRDREVVHRLLEFLFTVINEIKILEVDVPIYIPACWVVSTCLEFLRMFEKKEMADQPTIACLAQIYDYAREKLLLIGESLKLLPSDEQTNPIHEVAAGLCRTHQVKDDSSSGSKSLLNGILNKTAFEKLYLILCEKTRLLYTNVGRHRFAIKAAIDLAKFHLLQKEYSLAETYLERALHTFGQRQWEVLHIDVLEPLAECLCNLRMFDRYLWSLACLSCTKTLSFEKRVHYSKEFLIITEKPSDKGYVINTEPLISIDDVKINLVKEIGHVGEIVSVILNIKSNLPMEFQCDGMEIRLRYTETDHTKSCEVDGDNTPSKPPSNVVKWSEIIKKPDTENQDNAERKMGLLKRIRSRRAPKQIDQSSNSDNIEKDPLPDTENATASKLVHSSKIVNRKIDVSTRGPVEKNATTLAEIAKGASLAKEILDDRFKSNLYRTDSASSSLSNVSIASDVNDVNNEKIIKNSDAQGSEITQEGIDTVTQGSADNSNDLNEFRNVHNGKEHTAINNNSVLNGSELDGFKTTDRTVGKNSVDFVQGVDFDRADSNTTDTNVADANKADSAKADFVQLDSYTINTSGVDSNAVDISKADANATDPIVADATASDSTLLELNKADSDGADRNITDTNTTDLNTVDDNLPGSTAEILNEEDTPSDNTANKDITDGYQNGDIESNLEESIMDEILEEIEEEPENLPAQKLTSSATIIRPGLNYVSLTAKVLHEGRYTLQSLSCKVGNVTLYHLLGLPRKSRAFFVVSDPPKFTWTSSYLAECLLLGSKQRIHVTLSNGPGFIPACSVIRISTSTGLEFPPVSPSSVFVYSPNKKDDPKEGAMQIELEDLMLRNSALMYLPECGPYDMVDLFFDVLAPVSSSQMFGHMARHEVSLECLWLSEVTNAKTKLESIFYEPFTIDHDFYISSGGSFLHTILRNLNPVQITIQNPELKCLDSNQVSFTILQCDIAMTINSCEDLCLIWFVQNNEQDLEKKSPLNCQLTIQFKTEKQEEFGSFCKTTGISLIKPMFIIDICVKHEETKELHKGSSYEVRIKINKTKPLFDSTEYILCILEDNEQWKYNDETKYRRCETELKETGITEIISEIVPCISGKLDYPKITLLKSLNSSANTKEETRTNRTPSSLAVEKLLLSRRTSQKTADDSAKPFVAGEVIFSQAGKFIEVNEPKKLLTDV